jgi:hypothetical protein
MAFIPQISVTAQLPIVSKTHLRSQALPCFSRLHDDLRPFFIQWHVRAIDISRIMSVSYDDARQKMQQIRSYYGKRKNDVITIEEFCAYTGIRKSYVRMHVVSRKMENEMIKTLRVQLPTASCQLNNLFTENLKLIAEIN